jgi:Zn-finger protein
MCDRCGTNRFVEKHKIQGIKLKICQQCFWQAQQNTAARKGKKVTLKDLDVGL